MADWLKKQIGQQVNDIGYGRATDLITRLGKSLPVTVAAVKSSGIVTVNFEVDASPNTLQQIDVPILYPEYIRYPIQVGDKGLCVPADVRLGPISGIGTSTTAPVLSARPGNLGGLAFLWIGNTNWTSALDPEALELWGNILVKQNALGFFAHAAVSKQVVVGALSAITDANAKAVLLSLIDALAAYGLITNSTT
jgi:hypothetical protein